MTTKEVAQICGVTEKTVYNNANKASIVMEHGKAKDWTEEEVKKLQMVLMRNQLNQGTQVEPVKATVETGFQSGLTLQELPRQSLYCYRNRKEARYFCQPSRENCKREWAEARPYLWETWQSPTK